MISIEMLGYKNGTLQSQNYPPHVDTKKYPDSGDFITVVGNEPSAHLKQSIAEGIKKHVPSLKVETLVALGTGKNFSDILLNDHTLFWAVEIPLVMVTDTAFFGIYITINPLTPLKLWV